MTQPIVFITFYSRCGATEKRALDAAVGAVQARALIRLRRLGEIDPARVTATFPDCRAELERMRKHYVSPAESDLRSADAVIVGLPSDCDRTLPEWKEYVRLLGRLSSNGELDGKVGAALTSIPTFLSDALGELGLAMHPGAKELAGKDDSAQALGRSVADAARALKEAGETH